MNGMSQSNGGGGSIQNGISSRNDGQRDYKHTKTSIGQCKIMYTQIHTKVILSKFEYGQRNSRIYN